MKIKYVLLSSFILLIILFAGCGDRPGKKELSEQKALMAECQAAGNMAQVFYKKSSADSGLKSFLKFEIPGIISSESSGPFALKKSHGIIRIIEKQKDVVTIEGRPLESRNYKWIIVTTVTPFSVVTEVNEK